MIKSISIVVIVAISVVSTISAQETRQATEDEVAVYEAIEDYVYGLYDADSMRIIRSVDPSLRKVGYYYDRRVENTETT